MNTRATSNRSEIRALFLGANNPPIPNVRVALRPERRRQLGRRHVHDRQQRRLQRRERRRHHVVYARRAVEPDQRRHRPGLLRQERHHRPGNCPHIEATTTLTVTSDPLGVTIGTNDAGHRPNEADLREVNIVISVADCLGRREGRRDSSPRSICRTTARAYVHGTQWVRAVERGSRTETAIAASTKTKPQRRARGRRGPQPQWLARAAQVGRRQSRCSAPARPTPPARRRADRVSAERRDWMRVRILVAATGVSGTEGRATWTEVSGASDGVHRDPHRRSSSARMASSRRRSIRPRVAASPAATSSVLTASTSSPARTRTDAGSLFRQPDRNARQRQVHRRQGSGAAPRRAVR